MALRIAVLLSGSGTTLENLVEHRAKGLLDADVAAVLSSKPDAYGLERARRHGIPAHPLDRRAFADETAFQDALHAILDSVQPDLVVLAGFLSRFDAAARLLVERRASTVRAFTGRCSSTASS